MKKNSPVLTIAVGFMAGLVISGILGDIVILVSNAAGRVSSAWSVSKAEKYIAGGNFDMAKKEYEKALLKIKPSNKKLLAKVKNNMALLIFTEADKEQNAEKIKESVLIFYESLDLYKELDDSEGIREVETNIGEARSALEFLEI